ncbi:MAG: hypothetical protein HFH87_07155 [Lachnospiraceae bacterium]|nr:hypothetical protein [Lachnospiraceae bacterium]
MVLAFTEEQKKKIEARGMTVIEFKRRLRNMEKTIDDFWQVMKEIAGKLAKACNAFVEKFLEVVDDVKLAFEQISETYHYPTSRRYRIVKIFRKCTGTDMSFWWNLTFKIRRWLARSCC